MQLLKLILAKLGAILVITLTDQQKQKSDIVDNVLDEANNKSYKITKIGTN